MSRYPRARRAIAIAAVIAIAASCGGPGPSAVPGSIPPASGPSAGPSASAPATGPGAACGGPATAGMSWWNDRVFYEIFVRSFADSDGDGIGDLRGLTARLDDLNDGDPASGDDLGITGIWLMPVAEAASYHGYDVTDYKAVERDYGTDEDLRAFVAAAHERGIAVILDLVLNHTGFDHPWFQESRSQGSPKHDWYVWADADPGYLGPFGQPAWHEDGGRWYYGVFGDRMPDLNLRNPAVTDELVSVASYWLTEFGVDGFRLDAIKHLVEDGRDQANTPESRAWLASFGDRLRAVDPELMLVGEVLDVTAASAPFVAEGSVDLAFDFPLARGFLQAPNLEDVAPLAGARRDALEFYPRGGYASLLTNHDQNRAMSELGGSVERAKLAASLMLTDPGVPFLYYGEEVGVTGRKPDERLRAPMPWTAAAPAGGFSSAEPWQPMPDNWPAVNRADQAADPASLLSAYRGLIALRSSHAALRTGATYPVDVDPTSVAAVLRATPDETLLVVSNLGPESVSDYALTLEEGPLCAGLTARVAYGLDPAARVSPPAPVEGGGFDAWRPVPEVPARTTVVIALEP